MSELEKQELINKIKSMSAEELSVVCSAIEDEEFLWNELHQRSITNRNKISAAESIFKW